MATISEFATLVTDLQNYLDIDYFIETGTYHGESAKWATDEFESVISIEKDEQTFRIAQENCQGIGRLTLLLGDSAEVLPHVLRLAIRWSAFFWLDAHNEKHIFGPGPDECPVLRELEAIFTLSPYDHAILIDDAHCFEEPYDPTVWPRREAIEALAKQHGYGLRKAHDTLLLLPEKDFAFLTGTAWE